MQLCKTTVARGAPAMRVLCRHRMPAAALARPTTVCVRAFQQGAAAPEPQRSDNTSVSKRQQEKAVAMQHRPAMALPSIFLNDFNEMARRMDAIMSRSFGLLDDELFSPAGHLFRRAAPATPLMEQQLSMLHLATDILEDAEAFTIKADVPGMSKDAIKVSVEDGVLTISGERREERSFSAEGGAAAPDGSAGDTKEEGAAAASDEGGSEVAAATAPSQPVRYERSYGAFQRSFRLPPNVDADGITATAKEGVLTVTLPKVAQEAPKAKEVPIE